jgi:hypothetical protein
MVLFGGWLDGMEGFDLVGYTFWGTKSFLFLSLKPFPSFLDSIYKYGTING